MKNTKLAIIGSGPAGWTAAIYASRAQLAPTVFTGYKTGGQLMWTTEIENFPGFPDGIKGPELMAKMQQQAQKFGAQIEPKYITAVDFAQRPFKLWTTLPEGYDSLEDLVQRESLDNIKNLLNNIKNQEPEFAADSVIIATGAVSIMLNIPGEREFLGKGVSTCAVCDGAFFKDKNVYVVGGGDTAMEDALALTKFASQVTVVHRRDQFKASKIMQDRVLSHPKIKVLFSTQVKAVLGENKINKIKIINKTQEQELPADGLFLAIGHRPMNQVFIDQVAMDEKNYIKINKNNNYPTMTNIGGIFAAGDGVDYQYQQAITAAGMGCQAALDAERFLRE